ncbi:hypothetical protein CAP48_16860 [Advenella sp. S44]|nr:hypothetical protein CAP48_16860 [Advenella sp. S44]
MLPGHRASANNCMTAVMTMRRKKLLPLMIQSIAAITVLSSFFFVVFCALTGIFFAFIRDIHGF